MAPRVPALAAAVVLLVLLALVGGVHSQTVITLAGSLASGSADGQGAAATLYFPEAIAYSPTNNTFIVADTWNGRLRVVSAAGQVSTPALVSAATGASAALPYAAYPMGVALSGDTIYSACATYPSRLLLRPP